MTRVYISCPKSTSAMSVLGDLERPVSQNWKQWSVKRHERENFNGEKGGITGSRVTTFCHVRREVQSGERGGLAESRLAQRGSDGQMGNAEKAVFNEGFLFCAQESAHISTHISAIIRSCLIMKYFYCDGN